MPLRQPNWRPGEDRELMKAYRLAVFFEDMGEWMQRHGYPLRGERDYRSRSDWLIKQEAFKRAQQINAHDSGLTERQIIRQDDTGATDSEPAKSLQDAIDEANERAPEQETSHTNITPPAPVPPKSRKEPANAWTGAELAYLRLLASSGISANEATERMVKAGFRRSPGHNLADVARRNGFSFKGKSGQKKGCHQVNGGYTKPEDDVLKRLFKKGLCATEVAEEMRDYGYDRDRLSVYGRARKLGVNTNSRKGRPMKPRKITRKLGRPKGKKDATKRKASRRTLKCRPGWKPKSLRKSREYFTPDEDKALLALAKKGLTNKQIEPMMRLQGFPSRTYPTYGNRLKKLNGGGEFKFGNLTKS